MQRLRVRAGCVSEESRRSRWLEGSRQGSLVGEKIPEVRRVILCRTCRLLMDFGPASETRA